MLRHLVLLAVIAGPADYTLVGGRAGVAVYRQLGSPIIDLRAEGDFEAPPAEVAAILLDYPHAKDLSPHVVQSRVLRQGANDLDVYQRLHLPVVSDRDFTLHVAQGRRAATRWVRFFVDNQVGPPAQPGVVRVTLLNGGWDLTATADGRATHAVYRVQIDLAGTIPRWMVSDGAARDLPVLFEGVRRQLRRRGTSVSQRTAAGSPQRFGVGDGTCRQADADRVGAARTGGAGAGAHRPLLLGSRAAMTVPGAIRKMRPSTPTNQ